MPSSSVSGRAVGPVQLLALGVNGIVGVGIFFVPASVAVIAPGLGAVAVFALTGLALLPVALTFATLGRRFDEDGGPVVFARAAFGDRVSFLVGWVAYVSALFSTAAVMAGLTRATLPALGLGGSLAARVAPALLVTLLAAVVASGLRLSARVWTALTALKLLPLVLLVGAFAIAWGRFPAPAAAAPELRLAPGRPHRRVRLPGLRDRPRHRRPGPRLVPGRPLRHRGLAAPRGPALRRPRPRLRRPPSPPSPRRRRRSRTTAGVLGGARPRAPRRPRHERLRPRDRLRDDGDDAALPLRPGLAASARSSTSTASPSRASPCAPSS